MSENKDGQEGPMEIPAWELPSIPVGTRVQIVKAADEMFDPKYFGMTGVVVELNYNHGCGEIHEEHIGCIDPQYNIGFDDGKMNSFWREEMEAVVG